MSCKMQIKKTSPDIGRFFNVDTPIDLRIHMELDDVVVKNHEINSSTSLYKEKIYKQFEEWLSNEFVEVELLEHAVRDALQRLLQVDRKTRIHSLIALQRIALYKDFPIELNRLLETNVLNIFAKDNIKLYENHMLSNDTNEKYFEDF